jgi:hypothetical protein
VAKGGEITTSYTEALIKARDRKEKAKWEKQAARA